MKKATILPDHREITESDIECIEKIKRVVDRGYNAEVKRQADGSLRVYEVSKSIQ